MEIKRCKIEDLDQITEIFFQAFNDSIKFFVNPGPGTKKALKDIIKLLYKTFQEGFFVAVNEEERIVGYVIAIENATRLWVNALVSGYIFKAFLKWITGRYGINVFSLIKIILNKIYYVIFAVESGDSGQILQIAVQPETQGEGIGTKLMQKGMDYLNQKNIERVMLEVRPENIPAEKLYLDVGFKVIGKARDLQGEWLVMEAKL